MATHTQQIVDMDDDALVSSDMPANYNNPIDRNAKCKLTVIAILAVVTIIVVTVVAVIYFAESDDDKDGNGWYMGHRDYGPQITDMGYSNQICGTRYDCDRLEMTTYESACFEDLNSTNCAYLCATEPYEEAFNAYYRPALDECYCYSYSQRFGYSWRDPDNETGEYCFDITVNSSDDEPAIKYQIDFYVYAL